METQQVQLSPEADGFIPPWAEWDFNEWETCTDTELLLVININLLYIFLIFERR